MKTSDGTLRKSRIPRVKLGFVLTLFFYLVCVVLTLILFFSISSCQKKEFDFGAYGKLDGSEWGMPLANTKLDIFDLIKDTSNVVVGNDRLVKLVYVNEITSPYLCEFVQVPDIQNTTCYNYNMPAYMPVDDSVVVPYTQLVGFDLDEGVTVNNLVFSLCKMEYGFTTDLNKDALIRISIPDAIKDGESFFTTIHYDHEDNQGIEIFSTIDLSDHHVAFSRQNGNFNSLELNFEVTVFNNEKPDNSPYFFEISETANNVSFSEFSGNTGNIEMLFETGTMSFDLLKNRLSGNIDFENPILRLYAENSIGIPLGLSFSNFDAGYDDVLKPTIAISGTGLPNPWILNCPEKNCTNPEFSFIELSPGNSNIKEVFNSSPDNLTINGLVITNPGNRPNANYFTDGSFVKLKTEIELPLHGLANNLMLSDTFSFNFHDYDKLKSAEFKINIVNAFPVDVDFQLYFMDDQYYVIDSLFVDCETVSATGFDSQTLMVTNPFAAVLISTFNEESLQNIKATTSHIAVRAVMNTPNNTPIKIYTDNYLEINIGAKYCNY